jgi:hypothetical protein
VTTRVLFAPRQDYEAANLLLYRDPDNYIELSDAHQGGQAFLAGIEVNGHYRGRKSEAVTKCKVALWGCTPKPQKFPSGFPAV